MKVSVVVAGLVWPVLAFGQQMYTNADLTKFEVPGAYTNQDLRRLPPLAMQKRPAAALPQIAIPEPEPFVVARYEGTYRDLKLARETLAFELAYEERRVEFSESPFAGDSQSFEPRLGYRNRVSPLVMELQKRIAILDFQMGTLIQDARRDGVDIDPR